MSGSKLEMEKSAESPGRPRKVNQGGSTEMAICRLPWSWQRCRQKRSEKTVWSVLLWVRFRGDQCVLSRVQYLLAPEVGAGNPSRG